MSVSAANTVSAAQKSERYLHIDALRGLLLVMMAVNHIPSDLQIVSNHIFGFMSAAEGFVFLSGLISGLVYSRRYYKRGPAEMKDSAARRALGIYAMHAFSLAAVLLGLRVIALFSGMPIVGASSVLVDHPIASFVGGLLLVQQPSLFDILPMYCVFLLITPAIVIACSRGDRKAVVAGSFLLWVLANAFSPQHPLIHGLVNSGSFNLLAWQLLFVLGCVCGHAWATGQRLWPRPSAALIALALIAAAGLYCVRHSFLASPIPATWLDWLTNKNNVAPLRLANTLLLYYLVYVIAARFPQLLTWRPFAFLGQHSMFVFAAHILAAYTILAFPQYFAETISGRAVGTILMLAVMAAAAKLHARAGERRAAALPARQTLLNPAKIRNES